MSTKNENPAVKHWFVYIPLKNSLGDRHFNGNFYGYVIEEKWLLDSIKVDWNSFTFVENK